MASSTGTVFINGQEVQRDEKVLVERDGKFELISASKLKALMPEEFQDTPKPKNKSKKEKNSEKKDVEKEKKTPSKKTRKPKFDKTDTIDYKTIKSPYAMSPEMKSIMRKQAEAKAAREREEEEQARIADEEARKTAEQAWKAWLENKNKEMKGQKPEDKKQMEKELAKQRQEAVKAYRSWLHAKHRQMRKERLHRQQLQIEQDEQFFLRERRDCNNAFKKWARSKARDARKEQKVSDEARRQTKAEARRARRTQDFLKSLQESQQLRYVEYYGYRF